MTKVVTFPQSISHDPWRHGEPDLAEIMADPLVALVMRRDNLRSDVIWRVLRDAQNRLSGGQGAAA